MGSGKGHNKRVKKGASITGMVDALNEKAKNNPGLTIGQVDLNKIISEVSLKEEVENNITNLNIWHELDEKNNIFLTRDNEIGVQNRSSRNSLEILMENNSLVPQELLEKLIIYTPLKEQALGIIEHYQEFIKQRVSSYDTLARELKDPLAKQVIAEEINAAYKEMMYDFLLDLSELSEQYTGDAH